MTHPYDNDTPRESEGAKLCCCPSWSAEECIRIRYPHSEFIRGVDECECVCHGPDEDDDDDL